MTSSARATVYLGRLVGVLVACAAGIAPAVQAAPVRSAARSTAHVYVLTGLLGMSPGFDQLAEKIRRAGVPASVSNHSRWYTLAGEAIAQYRLGQLRSIVIIGHSLGGGAAMDMATELGNARIPVDLVATIDPVGTLTVPSNVRRTMNFYVQDGVGSPVRNAGTAHSAIQNVSERNPAIGHFSIIAAHEQQLLSSVLAATRSGRPAPKDGAPTAHAQAGPAN